MRVVSTALRAALDAGERVIHSTFTVDWDADGIQDIDDLSYKVGDIGMRQSLESSLPPQVQVVPGVAVAELTAKIARGNTARYAVPVSMRAFGTSQSSAATTTWTINKPAGAKTGDVILISIFVSRPGFGSVIASWDVLRKTNVPFVIIATRGDGVSAAATRIEGILMQRRVVDSEPSVYTITLPNNSNVTYGSVIVDIGDQNIMGITDFGSKGEDNTDTAPSILVSPVTVDVQNSLVVSFFGAASYAVTGIGFTPLDATDVEQTEFTVTGVTAPSMRIGLTTNATALQGRYQKGVTITGSPGASAVATLGFTVVLAPKLAGDESQHAAWTFSELNQNSPYAGKRRLRRPTRWLLNVITDNGFESVPIFTGYTTAPSASSDRTAVIKALDGRENMRNTGQGIDIVAEYPGTLDVNLTRSYPALPGLEATWVVSRSFFLAYYRQRSSTIFTYEALFPTSSGLGYFASPLASRYGSVWAPMHGSAYPLLGQLAYAFTETVAHSRRRVSFSTGPWVAATRNEATGATIQMGWQFASLAVWTTTIGQLAGRTQCWIRRNQATSALKIDFPDNNVNAWDAWVEITTAGVLRFRVEAPSVSRTITGPTISADSLWHFVGVHFDSTAGSVTFRVDSVNIVVAMSTWANAVIPFLIATADVTLTDGMQLAELQVNGGYSDANSSLKTGIPVTEAFANENFTPNAFIDKSENILDAMPYIDPDSDTFNVISAVASAEFAALFFDADGYPHYRTARSDMTTTGQIVQKQVTARRTIKQIAYESGVLQICNIVSVSYNPFVLSLNTQVFSASGVITVLPGQTIVYTIVLQGPLIRVDSITYTAYSAPDGTGTNLTGLVSVFQGLSDAGTIELNIRNDGIITANLVDNTGQPNLKVNATYMAPLSGNNAPIMYQDSDSIREWGEQPLPATTGSEWVQREDSAASIALKLLSDLCQPKPVITNLSIKGDPTLEFGDMITVQDVNGLGVSGQYRITGKDPNMSPDGGFTQDLVVRSAAAIAYWDVNSWDDGTVWG